MFRDMFHFKLDRKVSLKIVLYISTSCWAQVIIVYNTTWAWLSSEVLVNAIEHCKCDTLFKNQVFSNYNIRVLTEGNSKHAMIKLFLDSYFLTLDIP